LQALSLGNRAIGGDEKPLSAFHLCYERGDLYGAFNSKVLAMEPDAFQFVERVCRKVAFPTMQICH
jgi:hypothetical protein